jgi:hypothetical protein
VSIVLLKITTVCHTALNSQVQHNVGSHAIIQYGMDGGLVVCQDLTLHISVMTAHVLLDHTMICSMILLILDTITKAASTVKQENTHRYLLQQGAQRVKQENMLHNQIL